MVFMENLGRKKMGFSCWVLFVINYLRCIQVSVDQTCARYVDPKGGIRGGISKIFRRGGIEGGIFFDDEMRKKPEKNIKPGFLALI